MNARTRTLRLILLIRELFNLKIKKKNPKIISKEIFSRKILFH